MLFSHAAERRFFIFILLLLPRMPELLSARTHPEHLLQAFIILIPVKRPP
jgi:hypothetical protein